VAVAGWIEDRWLKKTRDPETGERERTDLWGSKTKRYRVCGIPGVPKRSFKTSAEAKKWQSEASTDAARGNFYDPRRGQMTLREYVETTWWPNLRMPPTTLASMKSRIFKHILPHLGAVSLNRIGHEEIRAWEKRAAQDIDAGTLAVAWQNFSSIMQAAYKAKRIPANPFRDEDFKAPQQPKTKAKAWSQEQVQAVYREMLDRYRITVKLGVGAGLRQGEVLGLSPDDFDGDVIHVTRQIIIVGGKLGFSPPKRNKERDTCCPPELADDVRLYAERFPSVEVTLPWVDPLKPDLAWDARPTKTVRLLVTTPNGTPVNRNIYDANHWKPSLARAGVIPPAVRTKVEGKTGKTWIKVEWEMDREDGFHVTRHTFASIVLAAGETIGQLAAWLGHADPAFTLRTYVHFLPRSGSRAVEALGRWMSAAPVADTSRRSETCSGGSRVVLHVLLPYSTGSGLRPPL
jgi:integrase